MEPADLCVTSEQTSHPRCHNNSENIQNELSMSQQAHFQFFLPSHVMCVHVYVRVRTNCTTGGN
jgi:hypothetical protein